MKKSLIITLAVVFVLGIAGTAFAASNPFVDVPAKHWAYESVAKLAKAGIVTGYGDGTFRGDRTMTRYEMAAIVAKAMANQDKANADEKAEIAKLEAEFSDELTKLGVRVSTLENKVGNIKFTGEVRARYEYQKDVPPSAAKGTTPANVNQSKNPAERTRFRLAMEAPVADGWTFKGRFVAENAAGADNTATTVLDRAYLSGKPFDLDEFALGRQQLYLGQGMVVGRTSRFFDGLKVAFGGSEVKAQLGAAKSDRIAKDTAGNTLVSNPNLEFADVKFNLDKNLRLTTTYVKDKDSIAYKTWSAGLDFSGIENVKITGEYGKNAADKAQYNGSDAKSWYAQVKYGAAKGKEVNSVGFWVLYSKADPNFDSADLTWFDSPSVYGAMFSDKKGMEYGIEWTVFNNGILSFTYNDWKKVSDNTPQKNFIANLIYQF